MRGENDRPNEEKEPTISGDPPRRKLRSKYGNRRGDREEQSIAEKRERVSGQQQQRDQTLNATRINVKV